MQTQQLADSITGVKLCTITWAEQVRLWGTVSESKQGLLVVWSIILVYIHCLCNELTIDFILTLDIILLHT